MIGVDQVLAAVLEPAHRPADMLRRERDQEILGVELAAGAETAAQPPAAFELKVSTNATSCEPAAAVVTQVNVSGDVLLLEWHPQLPAAAVLSARTG